MIEKVINRLLVPILVIAVLVLLSSQSLHKEVKIKGQHNYESVEIPNTINFAGEKVPLERFDTKENFERELLRNAYFHSQTIRFIKLAPRYFPIIEPILKKYGIPLDFKYLAVAESGFNVRSVSPAKAVGFWQFMRGTAKENGLEINSEVDERYHLEKSTEAACKYLLKAYAKYGNWTMVAAAYNAGMNGINRQIKRQKENNYYDLLLNAETQQYVFRILAIKTILENPEKYNFNIKDAEKYKPIPYSVVNVNGSVSDFADFAHKYGISYKLLKDFNPWLRDTYLKNPNGKRYKIKIPKLD